MTSKVDFLKDEELDSCKAVIVSVSGRYYSSYVFDREGIIFPWSPGRASCNVKIIKCRKGKRLELILLANSKLGTFKSEDPVIAISIEKK